MRVRVGGRVGRVQAIPEATDRRDLHTERLNALTETGDVHAHLARLAFAIPELGEELVFGYRAVERRDEQLGDALVHRGEEDTIAPERELTEAVNCGRSGMLL